MRAAWSVGLVGWLAGCTVEGGGSACDASVPGAVSVSVLGPDGGRGRGEVALFDGEGTLVGVLADGDSLADLEGGRYLYEVWRAPDGAGGAWGALDFGVGEVCVGGADALVQVEVAAQPSAGGLWAASWETVHVLPVETDATSAEPRASVTIPLTNSFGGIAVDPTGALWAATGSTYGARFVALPAGALTGAGEVPPSVEVSAPTLSANAAFTSLSFDGDGNLWATTAPLLGGFVGVVGWSATSLREARLLGGLVEQEPTWAATVDGLTAVNGGWVDPAGDLWATSADDLALVRIPADALRAATSGVEAAPSVAPVGRVRLVDGDGAPFLGLDSVTNGPEGSLYVLAAVSGAILTVPRAATDGGGDVVVDALQLGVTALPTALATDGAGGTWWSDTGRVGHVSEAGGDGVLIDVVAIERAGALLHDRP
jgi:hypothetical protein